MDFWSNLTIWVLVGAICGAILLKMSEKYWHLSKVMGRQFEEDFTESELVVGMIVFTTIGPLTAILLLANCAMLLSLKRKSLRSPEQWRVQAFLLPSVTRGKEYAYQARICHSSREADEQVAALQRSSRPGDIRIEREKIPQQ